MADYNDSYVPETESGVLTKPLTELHDPTAMKLVYDALLNKCEDIYESVSYIKLSWLRSTQEGTVNAGLGLSNFQVG